MEHADLFRIVFTLVCSVFGLITAVMLFLAAATLKDIRDGMKELFEWKATLTVDFEHLKTEHQMLSCQKKGE